MMTIMIFKDLFSMNTSTIMMNLIDTLDEGFEDCFQKSIIKIGQLLAREKDIKPQTLKKQIKKTMSKQVGTKQFSYCLKKLSKDILKKV